MTGNTIQDLPRIIIRRAAENTIIMVAIATKRVEIPIIIFVVKDVRISSSVSHDVRILKNVNVAVTEDSNIASETINNINNLSLMNAGKSVSLFPRETMIAAANSCLFHPLFTFL